MSDPIESPTRNALGVGCASALRADGAVCDQCGGLGWVRIKGYNYGAICGSSRPLSEVP